MDFFLPTIGTGWLQSHEDPGSEPEAAAAVRRNRDSLRRELADLLTSPNLLVLAGAGASRSARDENGEEQAPTMERLWNECCSLLPAEEFNRLLADVRYDPDQQGENIEYLLSQCQLASGFVEENQSIVDFIKDSEEKILELCRFVNDRTNLNVHENFLRRIARRPPRKPRTLVVTTNYDLCFETAAARAGFVIFDGFSFGSPQRFDASYFSYDIVRNTSEPTDGGYVPNVFYLAKLHGSVNWDSSGNQLTKLDSPHSPTLIYPRSSKYELSYKPPYFELMSIFQTNLKKSDLTVVVIGFGFNDDHISAPIMTALRSNVGMRIIVVDPVIKESENQNHVLMRLMAEAGDTRINLLASDFSSFVSELPDIVSRTQREEHEERFGGVER